MMSLIHYLLIGFETFGFVFFTDSFFDAKRNKLKWLIYPILYLGMIVIIFAVMTIFPVYGDIVKVMLIIILLFVLCILFYEATFSAAFFFATINYFLVFFIDCSYVSLFGMEETSISRVVWVGLRLVWIALLVVLRKTLPYIKTYLKKNRVTWLHFVWLPIISGFVGIYFYYLFLSQEEIPLFYSFISIGILVLNVVSLFLIQDSLIKEEKLERSKMLINSKQNQLKIFHDMQSLYERQGKKLHDYKKQLVTIQELILSNNTKAAYKFANELAKSVDIELSEVNTGHPTINAILNQEYRVSKSKDIGMIFSVSKMNNIKLGDEDIVVVLGNLLDNAIHECEKVIKDGKDAVIQVKMSVDRDEMIISIQNPVKEQVLIKDNNVLNEHTAEGHGIGLANVRDTVEKYGGSFVISCDESKFTAVVVI